MDREEAISKLDLDEDSLIESALANPEGSKQSRLQYFIHNPPEEGDIIVPCDGDTAPVFENYDVDDDGVAVTLFCKARIDDEARGWYLNDEKRGLTCIIDQQSAAPLFRRLKNREALSVTGLLVIKVSATGRSCICEMLESEE